MREKNLVRHDEVRHDATEHDHGQRCRMCAQFHWEPETESSCRTSLHFMTEREVKVLAEMRDVKARASKVKRQMRDIGEGLSGRSLAGEEGDPDRGSVREHLWAEGTLRDWEDLARRLGDLHERWAALEQDRADAREERMRLLGHVH